MTHMRFCDDAEPCPCPVCQYVPQVIIIEHDDDGEYIGCAMCKRVYRRNGYTCRWATIDGHSMLLAGTEPFATI